jgi:hypothetical protein
MYAATTKDEGNAADGRFSTACCGMTLLDPCGLTRAGRRRPTSVILVRTHSRSVTEKSPDKKLRNNINKRDF